MNLARRSGEHC